MIKPQEKCYKELLITFTLILIQGFYEYELSHQLYIMHQYVLTGKTISVVGCCRKKKILLIETFRVNYKRLNFFKDVSILVY